MTVRCPHCASEYLLPERLLGPRGARVRCPRCAEGFVVEPGGGTAGAESRATLTAAAPEASAADVDAPAPRLALDPDAVAAQILDTLAERLGAHLEVAVAEGRLWSAHGPELMRAWDAYRDALGPAADAAAFRDALRARWNVDLGSGTSARGGAG